MRPFLEIYYRLFITIVCILFFQIAKGQKSIFTPSQFGFSGIIYTPSAYIGKWKTIDASFTHFNKETSFTYLGGIKSERAFNLNLVFFPRTELTVKLTRPYSNIRPNHQPGSNEPRNWGIGDRSYSLRVLLLEEKNNRPALLIGIQDPFANFAFFNTNYLVASKSYEFPALSIRASVGYGASWEDTQGTYLQGLFGGIQANWKNINGMIEYDTNTINVGVGYQIKKRLFLNAALINAKYFSGFISYRFHLK